MSTRRVVMVLAVLLAVSVGCEPPRSKNPLSDQLTAKADPRLVGTWAGRMAEGDEVTLTALAREGALMDLVLVGNDGKKGAFVIAFEAFPSTIAGKSYLNLRSKTFGGEYASKVTVAEQWIFVRYELGKDGLLSLSVMQDDLVKAAVAEKKLDGALEGGDVVLKASSEQLAAFVAAADSDRLFQRTATFKRAKLDYPARSAAPAPHR